MSKKKRAKTPWRLRYVQANEMGMPSRPQVVDADGRPVNFRKSGNAELAVVAPELSRLLSAALRDAELWIRMLQSEHPAMKEPGWMQEAELVLRQLTSKESS